MRKKLLAMLLCIALALWSMPVYAAGLPITYDNSYSLSMGGGVYSYTVPFTGNFEITLYGAQGASYDSNSGGYGYTLQATVRLRKGDRISFSNARSASGWYESGSTIYVPGGGKSTFSVNGSTYLIAGGGAGEIDNLEVPEGVTSVRCYGGSGNSSGQSSTLSVHWCPSTESPIYATSQPDMCHGSGKHTHNKTGACPHHTETCTAGPSSSYEEKEDSNGNVVGKCTKGHIRPHAKGWDECGETYTVWTCGSPKNTWSYDCTQNGKIQGDSSATPGSCYARSGLSAETSLSNSGSGGAYIQLAEQDTVYHHGTLAETLTYRGGGCNLILKDDVVCYFKR